MDAELKKRFGTLVAAHRKRRGMTQQELADATTPNLSLNMIGRIETGKTGVSLATIVNLAKALGVNEAELFTAELPNSSLMTPQLSALTVRLSSLPEAQLEWLARLIDVALDNP
jgi:transcriptional regulator with XRE-family HTH domain